MLQVHGGTAWSLGVCTGQLAGFRGRSAVTSLEGVRASQSQSRRATGTRTGRTHTRRAFASSPNAVAVALSLCLAVLASPSWPCRLGPAVLALPSWPRRLGPAVLALPSWPCRLGLAVSVPPSWSCLAWLVCHCRLRRCHRLCLSRRGRRPRRTKRPRAAAAATGRSSTPPVVFRLLLLFVAQEHVVPCRVAPEWVLLIPPRRSLGVVDVQAASEPGVAGPVLLAHLVRSGRQQVGFHPRIDTHFVCCCFARLCHCHRL